MRAAALLLLLALMSLHAASLEIVFPINGSQVPLGLDGVPVVVTAEGGTPTSVTVTDDAGASTVDTTASDVWRGVSAATTTTGIRTISASAVIGGVTVTATSVTVMISALPWPCVASRLDPLPGDTHSEARDENASGLMVGYSGAGLVASGMPIRAVKWLVSTAITELSYTPIPLDLSGLYGSRTLVGSQALACNASGMIFGIAWHTPTGSATFTASAWMQDADGTLHDIGVIRIGYRPSDGLDLARLNEAGVAACWGGNGSDPLFGWPIQHAMTVSVAGGIEDHFWHLNGLYPSAIRSIATAIDGSYVYGTITDSTLKQHPFRVDLQTHIAEAIPQIHGDSNYSVPAIDNGKPIISSSQAGDVFQSDLGSSTPVASLTGRYDDIDAISDMNEAYVIGLAYNIPFKNQVGLSSIPLAWLSPSSNWRAILETAAPAINPCCAAVRILNHSNGIFSQRIIASIEIPHASTTYRRAIVIGPQQPPTININGPSSAPANLTLTILAETFDPEAAHLGGGVDHVAWWAKQGNGSWSQISVTSTPPFSLSYTAVAGSQTIKAFATDVSGTIGASSNLVIQGYDRPQVTLTTSSPTPTNSSSIHVFTHFSEAVSTLTPESLVVQGATAVVTGSSDEYDIVISPNIQLGTISIQIPNAAVTGGITLQPNAASNIILINFDSMPPATPSRPFLSPETDSGLYHNDGITNCRKPTITGSADPSTMIQIHIDGQFLSTCTSDNAGVYQFPLSSDLNEGTHEIKVRSSDGLGNLSPFSQSTIITQDYTPPDTNSATFTITSPASSSIVQLSGNAEARSIVTIRDVFSVLGEVQADTNGLWSYTTTTLVDGQHIFNCASTDLAGNTSQYGTGHTFFIDTHGPTLQFVTGPIPSIIRAGQTTTWTIQASDAGSGLSAISIIKQQINHDNKLVIESAAADNNGLITIIASAVDGANGDSSIEIPAGIVTDSANNPNAIFTSSPVTVDTTAPSISMSSSATSSNGHASIQVSLEASEDVGDLAADRINIVGGQLTHITSLNDHRHYLLNIQLSTGPFSLTANVGLTHDLAGNANAEAFISLPFDPDTPVCSATPIITGFACVGFHLSASAGDWSSPSGPISISYLWETSSDNSSWTASPAANPVPLTDNHTRKYLRCKVSATVVGSNPAKTAAAYTTSLGPVRNSAINLTSMKAAGTAAANSTISADHSSTTSDIYANWSITLPFKDGDLLLGADQIGFKPSSSTIRISTGHEIITQFNAQ